MLYSDSSSVVSVFEESSSDASDLVALQNVVDETMERVFDDIFTAEQAFFFFFEDPSGPFQRAFPDQYRVNYEAEIDLTRVLEEEEEPMEYENDEKKKTTNLAEKEKETETEKDTTVDNTQLSAVDTTVTLPSTNSDGVVLKPSVATRFLDKHPLDSILIPLDLALNRKSLREQHIEQFPGIDFIVGYINGESTGWALLLSRDPVIVAGIKKLYPSFRIATTKDKEMFLKPSGSKKKGDTFPLSLLPKPPSATRELSKRMHDAEQLASHIESIGGINKIVFIALDVEAAVVLRGAVPLPLEIALIPLKASEEWKTFHTFIHPGEVTDVVTACRLSCGTESGNHCIPFRNAAFLRNDYTVIAKEIERYLIAENVVFVNKGTCMDVNALRWIFGAARVAEGSDIRIPDKEEIRCFDIEAVKKALHLYINETKVDEDVISSFTATAADMNVSSVTSCWYHSKLEKELSCGEIQSCHAHCALEDADKLCNVLRSFISNPESN
ncbi:Maelstrom domain [Trypanosoma melophagium]|uniref:Maelstrom domain n=1 Tax=Trypanosoma melophagium TaxID=715481 RepID=UPI00351A04D4|nr:Maelstrom domain [Trypanosoma melophagium]